MIWQVSSVLEFFFFTMLVLEACALVTLFAHDVGGNMDTLLSSLCLSSLCLSSLCLFSLCLSSLSSLLLSSSLSSSSLLSELLSSLLASLPSSVGDCACSGSLGVCLFRTYSSSTRIFHHKPLGVSDLLVTWLSSSNSCKMDPQRWTLLWMV